MNAARATRPSRRAGLFVATVMTIGGLAGLIGLGLWQWERRAWKEQLIGRISEQLAAPPRPLPAPVSWPGVEASATEFRRVSFPAEFLHREEALIYATGSGLRKDVSGPGYWVMTPARLAGGSVVMVNRGFVPEGRQDPTSRREGQVGGVVDIVGVLRWPEPRGAFTPADDPAKNLWYLRDHLAIAAAKGIGPVAPFYVGQEGPPVPGNLPRVGELKINLPNNHLQYSITWFSLALVLAVVYLIWASRRLR